MSGCPATRPKSHAIANASGAVTTRFPTSRGRPHGEAPPRERLRQGEAPHAGRDLGVGGRERRDLAPRARARVSGRDRLALRTSLASRGGNAPFLLLPPSP